MHCIFSYLLVCCVVHHGNLWTVNLSWVYSAFHNIAQVLWETSFYIIWHTCPAAAAVPFLYLFRGTNAHNTGLWLPKYHLSLKIHSSFTGSLILICVHQCILFFSGGFVRKVHIQCEIYCIWQGMNEIIGPIYYVLSNDSDPACQGK